MKIDKNPFSESEYDRKGNLLYVMINPTSKKGIVKSKTETDYHLVSNIAIYDIEKDSLSYFFEKESQREIQHFLYETNYDEESKQMVFNKQAYCIFNNSEIEERDRSEQLFIIAFNRMNNAYEFWISTQTGREKRMVKTYEKEVDWRLDVFNKKILFIERLDNEVKIESIAW